MEMPFGLRTPVVSRNRLRCGPDSPMGTDNVEGWGHGKWRITVKIWTLCGQQCKNG